MPDYKDQPKLDFAIFSNKFRASDRHPLKTGTIEFTEEFLRAMVNKAKEGAMPKLKVAIWDRTSKSGTEYENARLEIDLGKTGSGPVKVLADGPEPETVEKEDDGLPF
tara:strand:+ start:659 stop:982 length:324 start_codon:yes stop_codon:yes gene_type:complete